MAIFLPNIAILTAIANEEYTAVKRVFSANDELAMDDERVYLKCSIPSSVPGVSHEVVIHQLSSADAETASAETVNLCRDFQSVRIVIMCGIACGFPNKSDEETNVCLGDIVVSEYVVKHDLIKETDTETLRRGIPERAAITLKTAYQRLDAAKANHENMMWQEYVDLAVQALGPEWGRPLDNNDRPDKKSRHFIGLVVSGGTLVKSESIREKIRSSYPKALALEMEGTGVAKGTAVAQRQFFIVRGISDLGDANKDDVWHRFAAISAAAFTRRLLELLPRPAPPSFGPFTEVAGNIDFSPEALVEANKGKINTTEFSSISSASLPIVTSIRDTEGQSLAQLEDKLFGITAFVKQAKELWEGFDFEKALVIADKFESRHKEALEELHTPETQEALKILFRIFLHWSQQDVARRSEFLGKAKTYIELLRRQLSQIWTMTCYLWRFPLF